MSYNVDLVERIERIVSFYCVSGRQFAAQCRVPVTTMNSILTKKSSPRAEILNSILDAYPSVDAEWLLTGRGEMLVDDNAATSLELMSTYSTTMKEKRLLEHKIEELQARNEMLTKTIENLSQALNADVS